MGDFHALELVHAANPLADEAELGRVHTPVADRGVEDIRKHPPICGVRAPNARREQGDLIVRGPLRQGIGERGAVHRKRRRSRGPLAFQALVALHATGDVVDGFALLPDQWDAVDAAIALVQEGHIVNEAIGQRYPPKPLGPLAVAEHGEKLCVRRCHCRHAHQPHEHGGHEHAPPLSLQVHPLVLPKSWRSSRSHASIAWGGGHVQCPWVSITVQTAYFSEPLAPNGPSHRLPPKPRPFGFTPNPKRAAIRCNELVSPRCWYSFHSEPYLLMLLERWTLPAAQNRLEVLRYCQCHIFPPWTCHDLDPDG
jgi:hypothetical protein